MTTNEVPVPSRSTGSANSTYVRSRREGRSPLRARSITRTAALAAAVLVAGSLAVPAAASAPERIVDESRVSFACPGGLTITEDGGHYEVLIATRPVGRDLLRVNVTATTKDVTASDQDGNHYRIVGSGGGTRLISPDRDTLQGQFGIRLVILDSDGGRIGRVHLQAHLRADGTFMSADRGDCAQFDG